MHKILDGKPEGRRPLERPRRRWKDNIRKGLRDIQREVVDLMHLVPIRDQWRAVLNMVVNL
jgi:hypothetical protein